MKTPTKFALLGVAATAIAMAVTVPVVAKGKMGERFDKIDANGDGFIDAAEIAAIKDAHFCLQSSVVSDAKVTSKKVDGEL